MKPKNPRRPRQPLTARKEDFATYGDVLYRIHRIEGHHRVHWDEMRTWGPTLDSRWDPHPEPVGDHESEAVMYTATDYTTAFGEVFQGTRSVTLSASRALASWVPRRTLRLLDLTDTWAVRNGASGSLDSAPHSTCRAWAREIRNTWPDLDGLLTQSTITKRRVVTLFAPARDSFPDGPRFSRPLTHRAVASLAVDAADDLEWPFRE